MLDLTPSKSFAKQSGKLTVFSLTLLLCTACGGGSDSSAPPPVAVNQTPVPQTTSKSVITEGQPFELDASGSTDSEGDDLTFSWRQISGPSIEISAPTNPTLSLVAPLLDANESVSFEVSVSDGVNSAVSTLSLDVEDLKSAVVISESTAFGTGGPTSPAETVPDPSIFEGRKPLDRIIGLTPEDGGDGAYRVHWSAGFSGHDTPVSSQLFSSDGERVGTQTDGVFLGGDQGTFERDGRTLNSFTFGVSFATIRSGDTLFNFNGELELSDRFTIKYTTHTGLVDGEVDGFGNELIPESELPSRIMGGDFTAISENNALLILSERTTDDLDDEEAVVEIKTYVVDEFGQATQHELDEYVSNGTSPSLNVMTVTPFDERSYLTAWSQNTAESGYDIRMQRANEDGIVLGPQVTVSETTDGNQLDPRAATLANGNIVITWLTPTETGEGELRARVIQLDGSFATDEMGLDPQIAITSTLGSFDHPNYILTPLSTNEVLLTWETRVEGAREIKAIAYDAQLQPVSNIFDIASGEVAENIETGSLKGIALEDDRVILSWYNDHPFGDERADTSHTVGFYPVGRE